MTTGSVDLDAVAESTLVTRPGRPGDAVRKVARIERETGTDSFALLVGEVRRERTLASEEVLVEGIETVVELGTADDVDRLLDGLERLRDGDGP